MATLTGAGLLVVATPTDKGTYTGILKVLLLREATGTDELLITTITHDHADRVRSYRLLAQEWARR